MFPRVYSKHERKYKLTKQSKILCCAVEWHHRRRYIHDRVCLPWGQPPVGSRRGSRLRQSRDHNAPKMPAKVRDSRRKLTVTIFYLFQSIKTTELEVIITANPHSLSFCCIIGICSLSNIQSTFIVVVLLASVQLGLVHHGRY